MDDTGLAERLQILPPELYDIVYQYTFTAATGVRKIDKAYRPPNLLAVDRRSRKHFARSVYGGRDTYFACHVPDPLRSLTSWLKSLPEDHRKSLREVKFMQSVYRRQYAIQKEDADILARSYMHAGLSDWREGFVRHNVESIQQAFYIEVVRDQSNAKKYSDGAWPVREQDKAVVTRIYLDDPQVTPQERQQVYRVW